MKTQLSMLALSIALGVAAAQNPPQNPPPPNPPAQAAPQSTTPATPQTTPQTTSPGAATAPATAPENTPSTTTPAAPAEVKTSTFKGVLVDMACAAGKSPSAEAAPAKPSGASKAPAADQSNSADRSTGDSGAGCPASASSTELGLKLADGKTVRFDAVGNQRAQDALKNDKRWTKDLGANKPLHVKADGVLNGDKLIVMAIH